MIFTHTILVLDMHILPILIKSIESSFSRFSQKLCNLEIFRSFDFGKLFLIWNLHKICYNIVLICIVLQFLVGSAHSGVRLTGPIAIFQQIWYHGCSHFWDLNNLHSTSHTKCNNDVNNGGIARGAPSEYVGYMMFYEKCLFMFDSWVIKVYHGSVSNIYHTQRLEVNRNSA